LKIRFTLRPGLKHVQTASKRPELKTDSVLSRALYFAPLAFFARDKKFSQSTQRAQRKKEKKRNTASASFQFPATLRDRF